MGGPFLASGVFIFGMVATVAASVHPNALPARDPANSLTIVAAASAPAGLVKALWWWVPGMLLVGCYTFVVYTRFLPRRVLVTDDHAH